MKDNVLIEELRDMVRHLKQFNITHVTKKANERKFELLCQAFAVQREYIAVMNLSGDINVTVDGINITITSYKLFPDERQTS